MTRIPLAIGLALAVPAAARAQTDSAAVAAVRASWLQATRAMDLDGMTAVLADDASLPLADAPTRMGKDAIADYWRALDDRLRKAGMSTNPLVLELASFRASGPYAIETGTYGPGDATMDHPVGTFTFVYRHDRSGRWTMAWLSLWPDRAVPQ